MSDWKSEKYYYFADDLEKYPGAWCYVVWSRRGSGKTYSALRTAYEDKIPLVYMKRTIDDVNMVCLNRGGLDMSPYVPINRDAGYNIHPRQIVKGVGGFYDQFDPETGNATGAPFSYIVALNAIKSIKGVDLSHCDWILFDEFIPQRGEIVKRVEGEMLLDVYMTIARDRNKRGRGDLKLILFANAENISTPVTNELQIVDDMVSLMASGETHLYLEDRGILLHHITEEEYPVQEEEKSGIYKAMAGTAWGEKAFGGLFTYNDFSNVNKQYLKNYVPVVGYHYKQENVYIYRKEEKFYFTSSRNDKVEVYDLNRENDQKRFYYDYVLDLRNECIENRVSFEKYTMYDLLVNYKDFFRI